MHDDEMMRANQKSQKSERWALKRRHHHHHDESRSRTIGGALAGFAIDQFPSSRLHTAEFRGKSYLATPSCEKV
jgi:hypothetical protein